MPMWKGEHLRMQPLDKRRELLRTKAMPKLPAIHFSDSFPADAEKMISAARTQGLRVLSPNAAIACTSPAGGTAPG